MFRARKALPPLADSIPWYLFPALLQVPESTAPAPVINIDASDADLVSNLVINKCISHKTILAAANLNPNCGSFEMACVNRTKK
jgi:hypothetical protein